MIRFCGRIAPLLLTVVLLAGCGAEVQSGGGMQGYKETKSMVLDILKSEEGQKAIHNASAQGGGMQMQMLGSEQNQLLQTTVKDVMTSPGFSRQLEMLMTDPKFAGEFAKAISKENKSLHKALMQDPEYQTMLIQVMKNPEAEKMILDVMRGTVFRKQIMSVFQESLENPLFRMELMELMKKAIEEETRPKKQKDDPTQPEEDNKNES